MQKIVFNSGQMFDFLQKKYGNGGDDFEESCASDLALYMFLNKLDYDPKDKNLKEADKEVQKERIKAYALSKLLMNVENPEDKLRLYEQGGFSDPVAVSMFESVLKTLSEEEKVSGDRVEIYLQPKLALNYIDALVTKVFDKKTLRVVKNQSYDFFVKKNFVKKNSEKNGDVCIDSIASKYGFKVDDALGILIHPKSEQRVTKKEFKDIRFDNDFEKAICYGLLHPDEMIATDDNNGVTLYEDLFCSEGASFELDEKRLNNWLPTSVKLLSEIGNKNDVEDIDLGEERLVSKYNKNKIFGFAATETLLSSGTFCGIFFGLNPLLKTFGLTVLSSSGILGVAVCGAVAVASFIGLLRPSFKNDNFRKKLGFKYELNYGKTSAAVIGSIIIGAGVGFGVYFGLNSVLCKFGLQAIQNSSLLVLAISASIAATLFAGCLFSMLFKFKERKRPPENLINDSKNIENMGNADNEINGIDRKGMMLGPRVMIKN